MSSEEPIPDQRYRRRIVGLGAIGLVVIFIIGAAITVPRVQDDLTDRVEQELIEADIAGVTASFSGQDGTLMCTESLLDPDAAQRIAEDLRGVRAIDLDRTCVAGASEPETETTEPAATEAPPSGSETAVTPTIAAPSTEPQLDSIAGIIDGDPLFSQLAELLDTADLTGTDGIDGEGPFTVLAPTDVAFDAAFDELGADAFDALTSDPDQLRTVLLHHVTEGQIRSRDFVAGPLTMLDGTTIEVDPDGADGLTFTSADVTATVADPATQLDIEAANGVVHAIDELLLPADLEGLLPEATTTAAAFEGGQIVLTGTVQSEEQRLQLIASAAAHVDPANIADQLTVDPVVAVAQADLDRLAGLVGVMLPNLVSGEAALSGSALSLTGVYVSEAANATLGEFGAALDAAVDLSPRATADETSAQALQDELNEFVRLNPVQFEQGSTVLTPEANAVIEQIAARALRLDGTSITIVGHTDTDGAAAANQLLSDGRAATVLQTLVVQGVPADILQFEGRGATSPILGPDGVEDKAASRRVEFIVQSG